jgi:hypothetical protein
VSDPTDPFNTPGKGLDYTLPVSRDDTDPLSPTKLNEREMTCRQTIREWDRLCQLAVEPARDPAYRILVTLLREIEEDLPLLISIATCRLESTREMFVAVLKLDMRTPENITARVNADNAYTEARAILDRLNSIQNAIRRRLHPHSKGTT